MVEPWIPITIAAALLQTVRSGLQKHLKPRLGTVGATFVRFSYAVPLALLYVAVLPRLTGEPLPRLTASFAVYAVVGAIAQILGTALLIRLFSFRSFAVATTYSKTETVQGALLGLVLLGEGMRTSAFVGILISLVGVVAMSVARSGTSLTLFLRSLAGRPALIGLANGAMFAVAAICYRGAALALDGGSAALRAALTLASVTVFQTAVMAIYMRLNAPGTLRRVAVAWRTGVWVGVSGAVSSACWFTAMTLQIAAYVLALGQIELVFALLSTYFVFRERPHTMELAGMALFLVGILTLVPGP